MLEYEADGARLLHPSTDEWGDLLAGRVAKIDGIPVLEPQLMLMFAQYALARDALSTPLAEGFLDAPAWQAPTFRRWWPRILLWPDGKPDLSARSFSADDRLYLKVYFGRFTCDRPRGGCGAWMDAYSIDRDAYRKGELYHLYQRHRWADADCPRCGRSMARTGLVLVTGLQAPPKRLG